jgi:hypothetical protein
MRKPVYKPIKMYLLKKSVLTGKATCTRKGCNETRSLSYSPLKGDRFIGREKIHYLKNSVVNTFYKNA